MTTTNETMTTKEQLAEVMATVATRKKFYNSAMASLRRIYEIEKRDRAFHKAFKSENTKADLAETMSMVFERKKFFNRAAKSLQAIYSVENALRAEIKAAKVAK